MFRVIEGGMGAGPSPISYETADEVPTRDDVLREAERRRRATGYDRWRNREQLTGIPIPREISYLAMQIGYAAEAIGRLAEIPADFRADIYWPA
ncbi:MULTISPECIES: hypothetical protein [Neorhizobium]|jgi:hypothetical protein|uniref:hypothetical protein n=1 Tax=Neorhizobium TaxID=1525371 RepID=UPI000CF95383|nr:MULTISPECIES: hypothetical protein [Neorhizobium]